MDETDPEVKGNNAVRVYVPTDVRPEMLDGPEAQALRNELDATRARLAEEQTAHATLRALWDARCGTIASVQARLEEAEGKLRHNVRAEEEFRALTADVNADRERELFATEEKLAAVQARLEAAERVVDDVFGSRGMAETLNDLCTCGGGGAEHPHSCGACRLYRVTRRLLRSALDAIPAAAPARAGDDS